MLLQFRVDCWIEEDDPFVSRVRDAAAVAVDDDLHNLSTPTPAALYWAPPAVEAPASLGGRKSLKKAAGMNRASLGVQSFHPIVQKGVCSRPSDTFSPAL